MMIFTLTSRTRLQYSKYCKAHITKKIKKNLKPSCMQRRIIKTFCKAIDNGFFATWPGLTAPLIRKKSREIHRHRHGMAKTKKKLPPSRR